MNGSNNIVSFPDTLQKLGENISVTSRYVITFPLQKQVYDTELAKSKAKMGLVPGGGTWTVCRHIPPPQSNLSFVTWSAVISGSLTMYFDLAALNTGMSGQWYVPSVSILY